MTTTAPVARRRRLFVAAPLLLALAFGTLAGCMNAGQTQTLSAMNVDRRAHGLRALPENRVATRSAQAWALHLSKVGKLSHSDLGAEFAGVDWCMLGENVGFGPDPIIVERAYMRSPEHRDNILNAAWTSAGAGYRVVGGRTYTVQVFVEMC